METKQLKFSEDLVNGDEFRLGDLCCLVLNVKTNAKNEQVLTCEILGSSIKKRSQLTVIIPKKLPIVLDNNVYPNLTLGD